MDSGGHVGSGLPDFLKSASPWFGLDSIHLAWQPCPYCQDLSGVRPPQMSISLPRFLTLESLCDAVLSLTEHVNRVSRLCLYHLSQLCTILHCFPLKKLLSWSIPSFCTRVHQDNAASICRSSFNVSKLQSVLNTTTHLIGGILDVFQLHRYDLVQEFCFRWRVQLE